MKKSIKHALNQIAPKAMSSVQAVRSRRLIEKSCIKDGRYELSRIISDRLQAQVASGPFQGMMLAPRLFKQHMSPKLIGSYEDELHEFLISQKSKPVDRVINIGSAEGFYAVGACLLWTGATVYSYDLDPKARRVTEEHGRLNHVSERLRVLARAKPQEIEATLREARSPFVFCDCEGCEADLLNPSLAPSLDNAIIACEMHPENAPRIEEQLTERFSRSHNIQIVYPTRKTPEVYKSTLKPIKLTEAQEYIAVNEYRGYTPWLVATPANAS